MSSVVSMGIDPRVGSDESVEVMKSESEERTPHRFRRYSGVLGKECLLGTGQYILSLELVFGECNPHPIGSVVRCACGVSILSSP